MHSESNLLVFWIALGVGVPILAILARGSLPFRWLLFVSLILSTLFNHGINFYSREYYRAATRGIEITSLDLLALALALAIMLRPSGYRVKIFVPLMMIQLLYLAFAIISWLAVFADPQASDLLQTPNGYSLTASGNVNYFEIWLYPLFEISKIMRGILVFWVVATFTRNEPQAIALALVAMFILVAYLTSDFLYQRYILRLFRGAGAYNEISAFAAMIGLFAFPFAFVFKGTLSGLGVWALQAIVFVILMITLSRVAIVGYIVIAVPIIIWGIAWRPTGRNLLFVGLLFVCMSGMFLKAGSNVFMRFASTKSDVEFRNELNEIAWLMAKDHLFGVGLGNYAAMDWIIYGKQVTTVKEGWYIVAHNVWFLTLGEMGIPGFLAFLFFWIRYYQIILRALTKKFRRLDVRYAYPVMIGSFGSSLLLQFENYYHFSYRITLILMLWAVISGITVGKYMQMQDLLCNKARRREIDHEKRREKLEAMVR